MVYIEKYDPKTETTNTQESTKVNEELPAISKALLDHVKGRFQLPIYYPSDLNSAPSAEAIAIKVAYDCGCQQVIRFLEDLFNKKNQREE